MGVPDGEEKINQEYQPQLQDHLVVGVLLLLLLMQSQLSLFRLVLGMSINLDL